MANKQRGEEALKLLGKEYILRPTFEALCEIEDKLDISIPNLIGRFEAGNIRIRDLAVIIWAGVHGYVGDGFSEGQEPTIPQIGNALREHGLAEAMAQGVNEGRNPIIRFVERGIMGDKTPEELKATNPDSVSGDTGNVPKETKAKA